MSWVISFKEGKEHMRTDRSKAFIIFSNEEHERLNSIANSYLPPYSLVNRARIILMAAEGFSKQEIATKYNLSPQMVSKWRQR